MNSSLRLSSVPVPNDSLRTYTWDDYGRTTTIDSVNLTYDALDRMTEQNRSGVYTQIVYAPTGQKLAIMTGQTLQKAFVPLPSGGQAVFNSSGLLYYGHPDHLGSTRFASTPSRTMYFDTAYAPFGEPYAHFRHRRPLLHRPGQDTVAGLYDFPAREYSIQGRWPSPDPAGLAAVDPSNPQSWNRYAYVINDPLDWVDPSGLDPCPNDNSWGAQLCKQAQAFRSTTYYATWDEFSLLFKTACGESGCVTSINPNALSLLTSGSLKQTIGCFAKGAGAGALGAGGVTLLVLGAAAAGVSAPVITGVLGGAAVIGGVVVLYNTGAQITNGNWAGVAFNIGSIVGGAGVSYFTGGAAANAIRSPASRGWSLARDLANRFTPSKGWNPIPWLGKGPDAAAAGGSVTLSGAGAAAPAKGGC